MEYFVVTFKFRKPGDRKISSFRKEGYFSSIELAEATALDSFAQLHKGIIYQETMHINKVPVRRHR